MPARDCNHEPVKNAVIEDGWTIRDDPHHLKWGKPDLDFDLGAAPVPAAKPDHHKRAVEVKRFLGHTEIGDFAQAIERYTVYHEVLWRAESDRDLGFALHEEVCHNLFDRLALFTGFIIISGSFLALISAMRPWRF